MINRVASAYVKMLWLSNSKGIIIVTIVPGAQLNLPCNDDVINPAATDM